MEFFKLKFRTFLQRTHEPRKKHYIWYSIDCWVMLIRKIFTINLEIFKTFNNLLLKINESNLRLNFQSFKKAILCYEKSNQTTVITFSATPF